MPRKAPKAATKIAAKKYDWGFWMTYTIFFIALAEAVFGNVGRLKFLTYSVGGLEMDKLAHILYMGALATLLSRRWPMWPVVLTGTVLALSIEFLQPYTHRTFDLNDAAWGIVGTWFAWGLYQMKWYRRILEGPQPTVEKPKKFDVWPIGVGLVILIVVWLVNRR